MTDRPYGAEHALIGATLRGYRDALLAVPAKVRDKGGDRGPLTEMDERMDRELYAAVHARYPDDGWISEESPHQAASGRYWVIDPIDGTRELVAGIPEWVVSVGLYEAGRPLYGWLYHPPSDTLWHGGPGIGAWANDTPVRVAAPTTLREAVVGVSRTDTQKGIIPPLEPAPKGIGSIAYKLGLVGAGAIHATVSITPKNVWDIAGGIAIVLGAGGTVVRFDSGDPIRTLDMHTKLDGGLVAAHPEWAEPLRRLYADAVAAARA